MLTLLINGLIPDYTRVIKHLVFSETKCINKISTRPDTVGTLVRVRVTDNFLKTRQYKCHQIRCSIISLVGPVEARIFKAERLSDIPNFMYDTSTRSYQV